MKNPKRLVIIILIIAILLLDFAALDDITTGNEPGYFGEYLTLILSIPALITLFLFWKKSKDDSN